MSTEGIDSNLTQALKDLAADWQETRAHWTDIKRQEFERDYVDPIPDHVARALVAIKEINLILRKVRKDCE
jgi:hypothetical protein